MATLKIPLFHMI